MYGFLSLYGLWSLIKGCKRLLATIIHTKMGLAREEGRRRAAGENTGAAL